MIRSIAHPTDFSPECLPAFEHALRLALLNGSLLTLLHVGGSHDDESWDGFPGVRETMARWGFLEPDTRREDVLPRTGVAVKKVVIDGKNVVGGLANFLRGEPTDLLVMTSTGRAGLGAMEHGSIATELAHVTMLTTLILGPEARPFVDSHTGSHEAIRTVLVPVDHKPSAQWALEDLEGLVGGLNVRFDFVHIGREAPVLLDRTGRARRVRMLQGPVIETLLAEARQADLIAMPMVGRNGLLDALQGSTTEQIVSKASRPVLALPV